MKKVSTEEAKKIQAALMDSWPKQYRGGKHWVAGKNWNKWALFSKAPYQASTHGDRYVVNFANPIAAKVYGQYDRLRKMPAGGTIAKPSFIISADGKARPGPLFIMEKMTQGWNPATGDWRYAMIMPGGKTFGVTRGVNAAGVKFCQDCHVGAKDNDHLFFLPEEARK